MYKVPVTVTLPANGHDRMNIINKAGSEHTMIAEGLGNKRRGGLICQILTRDHMAW